MKTDLQKVRKAAGYGTAIDFAKAFGINEHTYTGYEQGKSFSLEKAWAFADFLGCTLDELAGREFPQQYSDPRQAELNADYESLDETGKGMAAASVRGMAIAHVRGEDESQGTRAG